MKRIAAVTDWGGRARMEMPKKAARSLHVPERCMKTQGVGTLLAACMRCRLTSGGALLCMDWALLELLTRFDADGCCEVDAGVHEARGPSRCSDTVCIDLGHVSGDG